MAGAVILCLEPVINLFSPSLYKDFTWTHPLDNDRLADIANNYDNHMVVILFVMTIIKTVPINLPKSFCETDKR